MPIVRTDKRVGAQENVRELRQGLHQTLTRVDSMQAALDDLELQLGLGQESEIINRAQYVVMHDPGSGAELHSLDECEDHGCQDGDAETLLDELANDTDTADTDNP